MPARLPGGAQKMRLAQAAALVNGLGTGCGKVGKSTPGWILSYIFRPWGAVFGKNKSSLMHISRIDLPLHALASK